MCGVCGDVLLLTDWVKLSLDVDHEMWFRGTECLCGFRIEECHAVDLVVLR